LCASAEIAGFFAGVFADVFVELFFLAEALFVVVFFIAVPSKKPAESL
jgi:hypothetical protein